MPTQPQIVRLFTLARKAGLGNAQVHAYARIVFHRESIKLLTGPQYERFTRDLEAGRITPASIPDAPPADIAPVQTSDSGRAYVGTRGACRVAVHQLLAGSIEWPDAHTPDLETAADLLDAFRVTRTSWKRLGMKQITAMVTRFAQADIADWREAARRYLTNRTGFDETYFYGILRNVERERRARTAPDPIVVQPVI